MTINTTFRTAGPANAEHEGKRFEVMLGETRTGGRPAYRIRVESGEVIAAWSWEVELGRTYPGNCGLL